MSKSYRPGNGSEGVAFIEWYCLNCFHERWLQVPMQDNNDEHKKCDILTRVMVEDEDSDNYPVEWIVGEDGHGKCTAFKRYDWSRHVEGEEQEYHSVDPNQLDIFKIKP